MLNAHELIELRHANPVSVEDAGRLADALDLRSRLLGTAAETRREPEERRAPARRRVLPAVVAAAVLLAAILAATPARALVRDVLPFWKQPRAPQAVQVVFSELNIGFPPGMSPHAVSGDTRSVGRFDFGGSTRTLWVAPAKNGGFCSLWLPEGGGGCSTSGQPLSTGALLSGGIPVWINGDVAAPVVTVLIRFRDGSSVRPRIVWVSAPIDAGFFAYDVPAGKQVTAVEAYDRQGALVRRQTLR
jgi:hypothetical protein